jgi:2-keto-4-pentenoate hydratase/2-oxohepta-3-ene-1,7-dioic acid hydratase in catechol pathway
VKLANLNNRAVIVTTDGIIDVATASSGAFSSATAKLLGRMEELERWYEEHNPPLTESLDPSTLQFNDGLGAVSPNPGQVFAIGLNYRAHAEEMGLELPQQPMVFTKFASSVCGPNSDVPIPSNTTDFETELVVIFGRQGRNIDTANALDYVAGYCVGQDVSERTLQRTGSPAQFPLGKSFRNFSPFGPWMSSRSEIQDPNDLRIGCSLNGVTMQDDSTGDMVFSVAELIAYLSRVVEIRVGDIMYTGSPHGVGQGRTPQVFMQPGDVLESWIEGIGSTRNHCTAP